MGAKRAKNGHKALYDRVLRQAASLSAAAANVSVLIEKYFMLSALRTVGKPPAIPSSSSSQHASAICSAASWSKLFKSSFVKSLSQWIKAAQS
jgi:hypothetical protein